MHLPGSFWVPWILPWFYGWAVLSWVISGLRPVFPACRQHLTFQCHFLHKRYNQMAISSSTSDHPWVDVTRAEHKSECLTRQSPRGPDWVIRTSPKVCTLPACRIRIRVDGFTLTRIPAPPMWICIFKQSRRRGGLGSGVHHP